MCLAVEALKTQLKNKNEELLAAKKKFADSQAAVHGNLTSIGAAKVNNPKTRKECNKKPHIDLENFKKTKPGKVFHCEARRKVCVDQGRFILYEFPNTPPKFNHLNPERHEPLWQGGAQVNLPGYHVCRLFRLFVVI